MVTSKKELTDQLQRRVSSCEARIKRLGDEKDVAVQAASEEAGGRRAIGGICEAQQKSSINLSM